MLIMLVIKGHFQSLEKEKSGAIYSPDLHFCGSPDRIRTGDLRLERAAS